MMKFFTLAALVGAAVAQPNAPELQASDGNLVRSAALSYFLGTAPFA